MQQFIDKLISRLEEEKGKDICDSTLCIDCHQKHKTNSKDDCYKPIQMLVYDNVIGIVNQLAEEYKGGWIPCSERLPEYTGEYNVTVVVANELGSYIDATTLRFEKIEGRESKWVTPKDTVYRVLAWMPLPLPYQKEGE